MILIFLLFFAQADSPASSYEEGIKSYKAGDFQKSTTIFENLVQENPEDQNALFNLALSLFKEGEVGASLGYLRQIHHNDPTDETQRAITFAENSLGATSEGWNLSHRLRTWGVAFLWLIASLLCFLSFQTAAKKWKNNSNLDSFFWAKAILCGLAVSSALFLSLGASSHFATVIQSDSLLYTSPSSTSATLEALSEGERVKLSGKTLNEWTQVETLSGLPGWLPTSGLLKEQKLQL